MVPREERESLWGYSMIPRSVDLGSDGAAYSANRGDAGSQYEKSLLKLPAMKDEGVCRLFAA
jgi:hypothetical protein